MFDNCFHSLAEDTIDAAVDTGSTFRAERLTNPFRFNSIREFKAHRYKTSIERFTRTLRGILDSAGTVPAGVFPLPDIQGQNNLRKHFIAKKQQLSEEDYLWIRTQVIRSQEDSLIKSQINSQIETKNDNHTNTSNSCLTTN